MKSVPLVKIEKFPPVEKSPEDGLYRYLLLPGEEHSDQKERDTDRIWSKETYRLSKILEQAGNRAMYYLKDGPDRAFVKQEPMKILEDTQIPPDYVLKW